jgi:hypothetical protein
MDILNFSYYAIKIHLFLSILASNVYKKHLQWERFAFRDYAKNGLYSIIRWQLPMSNLQQKSTCISSLA